MMSGAAAAPIYGNYRPGIALCKMPPQRSHPGLLQRSCCGGLHADHVVEYQVASTSFHGRRRLPYCTAAASDWGFTLCKDPKPKEVRRCCLAPADNVTRTSSRTRAVTESTTPSSLTDISSSRSTDTELSTSNSYINGTTTKLNPTVPPIPTRDPEEDEVGVQELTVYEVNQLDRGSPMLLSLSKLALDWYNRFRVQPLNSLGDMVPFTNKLFDGSLKKRLGITAGIITVMRHYPKDDDLLFEAIYSFYFGDYGHISVKGPYKILEETVLTVTGGSGFFTGVYGTVQIRNVEYPFVLFYKFQLHGIPQLPPALIWDTVPPTKGVRPSCTASMPGFALPNFTD